MLAGTVMVTGDPDSGVIVTTLTLGWPAETVRVLIGTVIVMGALYGGLIVTILSLRVPAKMFSVLIGIVSVIGAPEGEVTVTTLTVGVFADADTDSVEASVNVITVGEPETGVKVTAFGLAPPPAP